MSHMSKYNLLIRVCVSTSHQHKLIVLSAPVNLVQIIQGEKVMRRNLMNWTPVRKASFGAPMMSLWRERRARHMSRMTLMMNDPPLDL